MNKYMKKHFSSILAVIALAFGFVAVPSAGVHAMTISPPTFDYSLNPGDTVLDVIKVYNEGQNAITLYPLVRNFTFRKDDEQGTPEFLPATDDNGGSGLAKWMTVDQKPFVIQPQERVNVSFAINIPKDQAQPGGHYGAILFSTQPPSSNGSDIGLVQQTGSLMLVRVSGDVKEDGRLIEVGFADKQLWYNSRPIDMFARFENDGNTHLRPVGNLFITSWYGRQVASIEINKEYRGVLPLSIRKFSFGWEGSVIPDPKASFLNQLKTEVSNFAIGKYKAELVLTYGHDNKMVADVRTFTVWPWRLMIVTAVALFLLILLLTLVMRAYNKAVIRGYEKMMATTANKKQEKK